MGADLIGTRPEGLFCVPGGFFVDPRRHVGRAVITHAHSDHARSGHGNHPCGGARGERPAHAPGRHRVADARLTHRAQDGRCAPAASTRCFSMRSAAAAGARASTPATPARCGTGRRATPGSAAQRGLPRPAPFAKAYPGLTDAEIGHVDAAIQRTAREEFGPARSVVPSWCSRSGSGNPGPGAASRRHRSAFPAHPAPAQRQDPHRRGYPRIVALAVAGVASPPAAGWETPARPFSFPPIGAPR